MAANRQQVYPNPGLDPGFRIGLDGRAAFLHAGFRVEVRVRPAAAEDVPYYTGAEPGHDEVVITGTVTECGVELAEVSAGADFGEPQTMRTALDDVLRDAVSDARLTVSKLVKRLAVIDAKEARAPRNERV